MHTVFINGLRLAFRIGREKNERDWPNTLELNLRIGVNSGTAMKSGKVDDTVCYKRTCEKLRTMAEKNEWPLLEQLGEDICKMIFENFPAASEVTLELHKFVIPGTDSVGLEIIRER